MDADGFLVSMIKLLLFLALFLCLFVIEYWCIFFPLILFTVIFIRDKDMEEYKKSLKEKENKLD